MDRPEAGPIETVALKASRDAVWTGDIGPDAGTGDDQVATDKSSIRDKVIDIVCEQMGASRDKVTNETSFINDLGADSLDTVELVMEFEDEFDLNIPDEDAEKIQTVGDAIAYIESHT
jgi:acyl carrier protein